MKSCPICHRQYEDETLKFCLDDGASLRDITDRDADATWNLAQSPLPPTVASPRPTVPVQATITARPEQFQFKQPYGGNESEASTRKTQLPWIFAIVAVLAVAAVLMAWLLTRGSDSQLGKNSGPTPEPSVMRTPSSTPEKPKEPFTVFDNTSFNGSRITYYPRPTFELCQSDCAVNSACKGLTWIRPGAYNRSDPAMCYLMSAVTDKVTHSCCISAERN